MFRKGKFRMKRLLVLPESHRVWSSPQIKFTFLDLILAVLQFISLLERYRGYHWGSFTSDNYVVISQFIFIECHLYLKT